MKTLEELTSSEDLTPPMVTNTPEGWPDFATMPGETWYERALNFEKWSGHPPLPLKYLYDDHWNVVLAEDTPLPTPSDYVQPEPTSDILENGGVLPWSGERTNGSSNSN